MSVPSIGRIVHYTLTENDAARINNDRVAYRDRCRGNDVRAGDVYPLVITRVWAQPEYVTPETMVNGQVLLDGNDSIWVTSVAAGEGQGRFA